MLVQYELAGTPVAPPLGELAKPEALTERATGDTTMTDEVIEAPTSLVIPEAANREISATVVLKRMLEGLE